MAAILIGYAETGLTTAAFVRFRKSDAAWWNTGTVAFEAFNAANIANYSIAATEVNSTGIYTATDPADPTEGSTILVKKAAATMVVSDIATGLRWQDVAGQVTVGTVNDKTGYSLSGTQTFNNTGTWTGNLSGSVGSVVGLTAANLDVAVSTRLATSGYTAPANSTIASIQTDTTSILTRLPTALVGGRMDASVGAMAANVITTTAINDGAITDAKITVPTISGVATGVLSMMVQLWRRFFKKTVYDIQNTNIKTYADNGTTVLTTQTTSVSSTIQSTGAAT